MKRLLPIAMLLSCPGTVFPLPGPGTPAPIKDSSEDIRRALESTEPYKQRAALVLISELAAAAEAAGGLKDKPPADIARQADMVRQLEAFLKRASNDENKSLALAAYGKLHPASGTAAGVIRPYLTSESALVRRGAGRGLVELVKAATRVLVGLDTSRPRPAVSVQNSIPTVGMVAGGGAAVIWMHGWVQSLRDSEPVWARFDQDTTNLLPLCAIAIKDPDDEVRISGCEGIRQISRAISDTLPDPAATSSETKAIDPLEAKLKWLFLQPVLESLNANVAPLADAMYAENFNARMAATRAAEAVTQARSLALASRRFPPDEMASLVSKLPPEDALKTSALSLMPALAARLDDSSPDIRLVAIEGFEHQGVDGRPHLDAIVHASTNNDIFVRWVAARTLGGLFDGASPSEIDRIVKALSVRAHDTDLDVQNAAVNAIGRGGKAARGATDPVLALTLKGQDPDLRVLSCKTLALIDADPTITVPLIAGILKSDSADVRKAGAIYLGTLGHSARSALPQLRPLLLDPMEDVRREAAQALLAIE